MAAEVDQFHRRETQILVLSPGSRQAAVRFSRQLDAPFPVLADPDNAIHPKFTLDRVVFQLVQQSGTVLIDRQGRIRHLHTATNPAASLDLDDLYASLKRLP